MRNKRINQKLYKNLLEGISKGIKNTLNESSKLEEVNPLTNRARLSNVELSGPIFFTHDEDIRKWYNRFVLLGGGCYIDEENERMHTFVCNSIESTRKLNYFINHYLTKEDYDLLDLDEIIKIKAIII